MAFEVRREDGQGCEDRKKVGDDGLILNTHPTWTSTYADEAPNDTNNPRILASHESSAEASKCSLSCRTEITVAVA
jgi:hypothetical protein